MSAAIAPNPNDPQAPLGMPARPWWIGYIRQLHLDIPLAVESGGTGKADTLNLSDLGAYKATIRTAADAITAQEMTVYRLIGSGSRTVTLPSASLVKSGAEVEVFIESPTITSVTISPAELENLISQGGAVDYVFTGLGKSIRIVRVGQTQWNVMEPDVNLTAADIAETDALKILTSTERTKLAGIAEGANNYTHPASHPQSMIEGLATALAAKAPLASPTFTGAPSGPTAAVGTNTTRLATTAFVQAKNNEWEMITGRKHFDDSGTGTEGAIISRYNIQTVRWNYGIIPASTSGTSRMAIGGPANKYASLNLENAGVVSATTPVSGTNTTQLATTEFVQAQKVSPALTGTPTAPTAAEGTNTTQIATTAFVQAKASGDLLTEGTPSGPTATGTKGMARFDADYFYVCTATNTWVRFAKDGSWT